MAKQSLAQITLDRQFEGARRAAGEKLPECAIILMDLHQQMKDLVRRIEDGDFARMERLIAQQGEDVEKPEDPVPGR
jgi:hypothetical protein